MKDFYSVKNELYKYDSNVILGSKLVRILGVSKDLHSDDSVDEEDHQNQESDVR